MQALCFGPQEVGWCLYLVEAASVERSGNNLRINVFLGCKIMLTLWSVIHRDYLVVALMERKLVAIPTCYGVGS